mgnify:CR=1 FL=1
MKTIKIGETVAYEFDMFDLIAAVRTHLTTLDIGKGVAICDITVTLEKYFSPNGEALIRATGMIKPYDPRP